MLKKRFLELGNKAYTQGIFLFTDFLGMGELSAFIEVRNENRELGIFGDDCVRIFGGAEDCERCMIRFGSTEELGYEVEFPIVCLKIAPLMEKFAEELNHRDFLGALMNLGIERDLLGDIRIDGKMAYLFCQEKIASFIQESLQKVRHTNVKVSVTDALPENLQHKEEEKEFPVASERLDGIIAGLYHISRSQSLELFRGQKVYRNGRLEENNSVSPREGDVVAVRGYGKFRYMGILRETKKGKIRVLAAVYC